jgi:hypothetical protein
MKALRSDPDVEVIPADDELFEAGIDLYTRRPDKGGIQEQVPS